MFENEDNIFLEGKELEDHIRKSNNDLILKSIKNNKNFNNYNKQIAINKHKKRKKKGR